MEFSHVYFDQEDFFGKESNILEESHRDLIGDHNHNILTAFFSHSLRQ